MEHSLLKFPSAIFFFAEMNKLILNFIWKCKESRISKQSWKRTKLEDLYFLISKLTMKISAFKTVVVAVVVFMKDGHTDQ